VTADFDTIRENLRSIVDLTAQADYVDVWESAALAALARVEAAAEQAEKALAEIALAEGPFDRDALTHAGNVIEAMADIARAALAVLRGKDAG